MKVTIIGSGIFGISIAGLISANKINVSIWTSRDDIDSISVPKDITITNDIEKALDGSNAIIVLTSSEKFKEALDNIKPYYKDELLLIGSKGLYNNDILYNEAVKLFPKENVGILSGPTFAMDIKSLEPVGFTYSSIDKSNLKLVEKIFRKSSIKYSSDVIGVSLCSVLKNAYSIGSGILEGMGYGASTRSLYLCNVIKELEDLFDKLKLDKETIYTYAGIGDLFQTASSSNSRNYTLGVFIGLGNIDAAKNFTSKNTIEGINTLKCFYKKYNNLSLDIFNTIYNIVINDAKKEELINLLL